MEQIKSIVASSIRVKQDILQDEALLKTVKDCITVIVKAFKNTWLPSSAGGFIPTGMPCRPRRFTAILLT